MAIAATLLAAAASTAGASTAATRPNRRSLYTGPAPRPGPDILYAPLATAPQLTNARRSPWRAKPILISGTEAYRNGEFIYQDFIYDDHGAHEQLDPSDPRISSATFSQPNGDYTYPANPAYANNAADLVEFRVKPLKRATAFRVTLNTMKDPTLIAFSIALGGTPQTLHNFPYGANVTAPADAFLTVHPNKSGKRLTADIISAATGRPARKAPRVRVDRRRRQLEVDVPHKDWNPRQGTVRMAMGVGLWDKTAHRYLLPAQVASATRPGGAGTAATPPAFFNVAFRTHEPMTDLHEFTSVPATAQNPSWWRDSDQGLALATGDISALSAEVNFKKLKRHLTDNSQVPRTGPMDRIMASHFEPAQGVDYSGSCTAGNHNCPYQGKLEPYAVYIPTKPRPARGYGVTLLLHPLFCNYNIFLSSRNQSELAQAGAGSIVLTPEARAPDGNYVGLAGADVFEAWADLVAHYPLDPRHAAVTGYSMGGIGTFKLGEQFPDLFGKAFSVSGTDQNNMLGNLRNVPVLMWNMVADEEVPIQGPEQTALTLNGLGYRYELDEFSPGEHNTFALNDEYGPAASFLSDATADRNPAHVSFAIDPSIYFSRFKFVSDHAYWVSQMKVRDQGKMGSIDAFSHGFGVKDPTPSGMHHGAGLLTGGLIPAIGYVSQSQSWGPIPHAPASNALDLKATNLARATIDLNRAHLRCSAKINLTSDGPITIRFAGCHRTVSR